MPVSLIGDLFRAHPYISFLTAIALLAVVGYLEIRAFPRELGAYWTSVLCLLVSALALHRAVSGVLGVLLATVVLAAGIVWLVKYRARHLGAGK